MNLNSILHTPSARWKRWRGQAQLFVYTRYSLHVSVVMMLLLMFQVLNNVRQFDAQRNSSDSTTRWSEPWLLVPLVFLLLSAACVIWIVETSPRFNWRPRAYSDKALMIGTGVLLSILVVSLVSFFLLSEQHDIGMFISALWVGPCLVVSVIPRLKFRWFLAACGIGLVAWATHAINFGDRYFGALMTGVLFMVVISTEWTLESYKDIARAEAAEAALKTNEERLRIAQQLHDSLGQSIAAMNLKTQLLDKLLVKNNITNPAITNEVKQLKELVDSTSTHMREVVHGYRTLDLAEEVTSATKLLQESDVRVSVDGEHTQLGHLNERARQVAGWFVREVSTNIIRHTNASTVRVYWSDRGVRITNNGVHSTPGRMRGLDTLQQRARRDGGIITAERDGDTFTTALAFHSPESSSGAES